MKKLFVAILLIVLLSFQTIVKAEDPKLGGTTISPSFFELYLNKGERKEIKIKVENSEGKLEEYSVQTGKIVQDPENPEGYKFEIDKNDESNIINLPTKKFSIENNKSIEVPVEINIPIAAVENSYFPLVVFSVSTPEGQILLDRQIVSIIYINVIKSEKGIEPKFKSFLGMKSSIIFTPGNVFTPEVENIGDTFIKPFGNIIILDQKNMKLGDLPVNIRSKILLPGQKYDEEVRWDTEDSILKPLFGKYRAVLGVQYNGEIVMSEQNFWIIPIYHILAAITLLAVTAFGVNYLIKRFSKRVRSKKSSQG